MKTLTNKELKDHYTSLYKQVLEGAEGEEYKSKKPVDSEAEKIQSKQYDKLDEILTKDDPIEVWIADFLDSDATQFEDKSKKEIIKMAIGAYYGSQKEATEEAGEDGEIRPRFDGLG